jgi:ribosomal protein S18 acetylase RimI-like enzyme
MAIIHNRWMGPDEVSKIRDIDRSEQIRTGYEYTGGQLQQMEVHWDTPTWLTDGGGDHTIAAQINFCRDHLQRSGRMYGAFDGEKLVGIGIIQQEIREGIAQLAYLHVSNQYRRKGIGVHIAEELTREAQRAGAQKMYVSATPTASAVGFYLSCGFEPVEAPIPELFELEPEDIHMMKIFTS